MLLFIRKWVYEHIPPEWAEAILSGLRYALWVALGTLFDYLQAFFTYQTQTWIVVIISGLLIIIDKKIHEAQKEATPRSTDKQTGLAGF